MAEERTELDIAKAIRDGAVQSGQRFGNMWLFAMRISGTGAAQREDEYTWRDPKEWTAPEFLARFNGLPVIMQHPIEQDKDGNEKFGLLTSEDYANRVVGAIMLPYAKDGEPWGIARIQDEDIAVLLKSVQLSTSPGVTGSTDLTIKLDDGSNLLVEGKPRLVCHLAICRQGVWDKGGDPSGIDGGLMTDDEKKEKDKADADAAKAKADAEEKQEKDPAEKEAPDDFKKKMDAMQARLDAYESAEKEREKEKADAAKAKADAEDEEKTKKEEREERAKADAEAFKAMKARLDAVEAMHKPRTDADEAELATEQSKADAVEQAWGRSAPRYMPNETRRAYMLRTLQGHKEHSPHWKDVDLSKLPVEALNVAAAQIRADSVVASTSPHTGPVDRLVMRERRLPTGHMMREFVGDIHTAMEPFRIQPRYMTFLPQGNRS